MRLPGYLIAFVLTLLLAVTTPVGTGAGAHQFDLLHPLFSHVHLFKGRLMTHEQMEAEMAAAPTTPTTGVAFGAGSGAGSDGGGAGISPALPAPSVLTTPPAAAWGGEFEIGAPAGREEPPPDPPPL